MCCYLDVKMLVGVQTSLKHETNDFQNWKLLKLHADSPFVSIGKRTAAIIAAIVAVTACLLFPFE